MKTYPGLLFHPNIPKPLHTMAPRVFLGESWWKETKQKAKAKFNDHCWSCGAHKSEAKYHKWLEAHECYSMDYNIGKVEYVGTVALCHSCHNYIHDGRLEMLVRNGETTKEKQQEILKHGDTLIKQLLESKNCKWSGGKLDCVNLLLHYPLGKNINKNLTWLGEDAKWKDYHMVINGVVYSQKFKSYAEWLNHKW